MLLFYSCDLITCSYVEAFKFSLLVLFCTSFLGISILMKTNIIFQLSIGSKMNNGDMCLLDIATTHTILREKNTSLI